MNLKDMRDIAAKQSIPQHEMALYLFDVPMIER